MTRTPFLVLGFAPCVGLCIALASIASADPAASREPRTVTAFHALDLAGTIGVEVTLGKPASVEVTGERALLDKVITTVVNGVLVINTRPELGRDHRGYHPLTVIVTAPDLSSLTVSGTGGIKVAGVANNDLAINVSGTGGVKAAGSTGSLHITVGGTGQIAAQDLAAQDAVIDIGGTGSATLQATRSLDVRISGTGSIDVHGHPVQVKKSVSGVGSVHVR